MNGDPYSSPATSRSVDDFGPVPPGDGTPGSRLEAGVRFAEEFFIGTSAVHRALEKLVRLLDAERIPYVVIGAMALNELGYQRVTVDIDIILTRAGLDAFKRAWLGRGYAEKFPGSRGLRDMEQRVRIDVILAGEYPGDGKPKPIAFPDPTTAPTTGVKVKVLPLPRIVELKLASGMTVPARLKDLADVIETIRALKLPERLADELDASVREKYRELWRTAQTPDALPE